MKVALIVNPYAGGKNTEKLLPLIEKKLLFHHIEYHSYISLYHKHLLNLTTKLKIDQYDAIIAIGGDGTNFQVLNGLLSTFKPKNIPPIGIIPVGSGNSFAKDLNLHNLEDGIKSIVKNSPKWVDTCSFTQAQKKYYFVNLTGLGFVTDVAKTAQKFKFFKDFSYIIGVFHRTFKLKFHYLELEIDGKTLSGENCFVEFCNSRFTGGNMMMAPEAKIDDGFMDIIIAGKMSRTSLLATLPKIFKGTHINHPSVRSFKAKKAKIKTWPIKTLLPDGELFGSSPATIIVHPKMIRYLT
ncbi:MAG: diacylglycerol kinase family lipid kinase [Desulfobacula sp.]|jgi:diacylglycerol kinase (ATP)|uniref:diacylglycerol/lipid kinase family protein n=1 Tax=Desulfobacula sp. TaxID=2593537 RepID=UPI001D43F33D|nr:diacylglycerol kinase family lipid kinase [Desulfobacula sp.]MBT3484639.1 diacylglycerol kinase family lipid kinase [Desulfobacula sp.]MBT3806969.1 diacylglycerol kinase family lipid kinase [Desulfobacula sp.]MBT4023664.1 diacylglycerol kinase family lipid kinase [Desulfobacula sp.]MBT4200653.1 diacylglycerol kinase family lipid kinase [Desulfobacula sp.]